MVSKPTPGTVGQGPVSVRGIGNYLPCTVGQGCSLVKRWQLLPLGHCRAVVQAVLAMSETTSQALWGRDACTVVQVCRLFKRAQGYRLFMWCPNLSGTVGQACRLFKHCRNLPPRHCWAVVQSVFAVSEPTSQALWGRDACTVEQVCRLFKRCQNLRPRHFGAGVQAV